MRLYINVWLLRSYYSYLKLFLDSLERAPSTHIYLYHIHEYVLRTFRALRKTRRSISFVDSVLLQFYKQYTSKIVTAAASRYRHIICSVRSSDTNWSEGYREFCSSKQFFFQCWISARLFTALYK